eukprot:1159871-Pelagomonas_calceolata.AAC.4
MPEHKEVQELTPFMGTEFFQSWHTDWHKSDPKTYKLAMLKAWQLQLADGSSGSLPTCHIGAPSAVNHCLPVLFS